MTTTFTNRLALRKFDINDDVPTTAPDIITSFDLIDSAVDRICTSATRPNAPYAGMQIYETDTRRRYIFDGPFNDWFKLSGPAAHFLHTSSMTSGTVAASAQVFTEVYTSGAITVPISGLVRVKINTTWSAPANAAGNWRPTMSVNGAGNAVAPGYETLLRISNGGLSTSLMPGGFVEIQVPVNKNGTLKVGIECTTDPASAGINLHPGGTNIHMEV